MAADPSSSWGLVEWAWPAIVTGLSVMSARIVYLQDKKIETIAGDVEACKTRDADHVSALAAHQLHTERMHPSKLDVKDALSAQTDRINEIMIIHNDNVLKQLVRLSISVDGMLARERLQRAGDSR